MDLDLLAVGIGDVHGTPGTLDQPCQMSGSHQPVTHLRQGFRGLEWHCPRRREESGAVAGDRGPVQWPRISLSTSARASSTATEHFSPLLRSRISTRPLARSRPITTAVGMPRISVSANFTPGLALRSS